MRFDTEVYLQTVSEGAFDPSTGNYSDETVTEEKMYANVTDTTTDDLILVYGSIKEGSKTVRMQGSVPTFDYMRIGNKRYKENSRRTLRRLTTFIISEVQ